MMHEMPTKRAEAARRGLRRYYTGEPCKRGHFGDRYTSSGRCVSCASIHDREWRTKNLEHRRAYERDYYAANIDRKREQHRAYEERKRDRGAAQGAPAEQATSP
jgi:hypothetical protein